MAAPVQPALATTYGRTSYVWQSTIANTAAPTAAEATGAGSLNLTGYILNEQFGGPTVATSRVTLPITVLASASYEAFGETTWGMADLVYSFDPQAAAASAPKIAYETLTGGLLGYIIRRLNVVGTSDLAADDFVDVFSVTLGTQLINPTGTDAAGVVAVTQPVTVRALPVLGVQIVA